MITSTYTVLLKYTLSHCFYYTILYTAEKSIKSICYTVVLMYTVSHCSI